MQADQIFEFRVRNDLSEMASVSTGLDDIGDRFALPSKFVMQLQIALDEALSNVVKYAWPEGGEHEATVKVTVTEDCLQIEIIDDGQPFDMRQSRPAKAPSTGKGIAYGGRGISMIKQLTDRVDYARIGDRNCLTLSKFISRQQQVEA